MKFDAAKQKYIQAWGTLGSSWGINKAMAQIHALLLVSSEPLCTDTIMEVLSISRGNANMNLRALMDWGIISKVFVAGERKEFFQSEKDIWELAKQVIKERRKRELAPVIKVLSEVSNIEFNDTVEEQEFKKMTSELAKFAVKTDDLLEKTIKAEESWFFKSVLKIFN